jgi:hypothetical protein
MISSRTNTMTPVPMTERDTRRDRASALNLHGLLAHWGEIASETWVTSLLGWEEQERARRSLERRLRTAHIGRFKPLCDFDWAWPKRCDRAAVDTLMTLEFLNDAANVVLVGPNGVGKSMIAQNIAHQALTRGHTVLLQARITAALERINALPTADCSHPVRTSIAVVRSAYTTALEGFAQFAAIGQEDRMGGVQVEFLDPTSRVSADWKFSVQAGGGLLWLPSRWLGLSAQALYYHGDTSNAVVYATADQTVVVGFNVEYWAFSAGMSLFFP